MTLFKNGSKKTKLNNNANNIQSSLKRDLTTINGRRDQPVQLVDSTLEKPSNEVSSVNTTTSAVKPEATHSSEAAAATTTISASPHTTQSSANYITGEVTTNARRRSSSSGRGGIEPLILVSTTTTSKNDNNLAPLSSSANSNSVQSFENRNKRTSIDYSSTDGTNNGVSALSSLNTPSPFLVRQLSNSDFKPSPKNAPKSFHLDVQNDENDDESADDVGQLPIFRYPTPTPTTPSITIENSSDSEKKLTHDNMLLTTFDSSNNNNGNKKAPLASIASALDDDVFDVYSSPEQQNQPRSEQPKSPQKSKTVAPKTAKPKEVENYPLVQVNNVRYEQDDDDEHDEFFEDEDDESDTESRQLTGCDKCLRCMRRTLRETFKFIFSHIGLTALVIGYTVAGAFLFIYLERDNADRELTHVERLRKILVEELWNSTRRNVYSQRTWTALTSEKLLEFQQSVAIAARNGYHWRQNGQSSGGGDGRFRTNHESVWTFSEGFLYAMSVVSTIGFGHLTTKTSAGKICTIIYAIFGIPMVLLWLTIVGNFLAKALQLLFCDCCAKSPPVAPPPAPPLPFPVSSSSNALLTAKGLGGSSSLNGDLVSASSASVLSASAATPAARRRKFTRRKLKTTISSPAMQTVVTENGITHRKQHAPLHKRATLVTFPYESNTTSFDNKKTNKKLINTKISSFSPNTAMAARNKMFADIIRNHEQAVLSLSSGSEMASGDIGSGNRHRKLPVAGKKSNSNEELSKDIASTTIHKIRISKSKDSMALLPATTQQQEHIAAALPPSAADGSQQSSTNSSSTPRRRLSLTPTPGRRRRQSTGSGVYLQNITNQEKSKRAAHLLHEDVNTPTKYYTGGELTEKKRATETPIKSQNHVKRPVRRAQTTRIRTASQHYTDDMEFDTNDDAALVAWDQQRRKQFEAQQRRYFLRTLRRRNKLAGKQALLALFIMVMYLFGGTALFSHWEEWSYLDSFYFVFVTLSTIGFGDLVPGFGNLSEDDRDFRIRIASVSAYIFFGMAILATVFALVQAAIKQMARNAGRKLRLIKVDKSKRTTTSKSRKQQQLRGGPSFV